MILGLTQSVLVMDAETGSPTDLAAEGAAKYWADPRTKVFMFGVKWLNSPSPAVCYDFEVRGDKLPPEVIQAIQAPPEQCMLAAANCEFDRAALARIGFPTPTEKWFDILVLAYIMGFAGRLNDVLKQSPLGSQKNPDGSRCISLFSKQFKPWHTDPRLWDKFVGYCADDAHVEERLMSWCLKFLDRDWCRPQVLNALRQELIYRYIGHRGIPVSPAAIHGAQEIMRAEKDAILERMQTLTGLDNPNSRDQLLGWLHAQGSEILDLTKMSVQNEIDYQDARMGSFGG